MLTRPESASPFLPPCYDRRERTQHDGGMRLFLHIITMLAGIGTAAAAPLDAWTVVASKPASLELRPAALKAGERFDVTVLRQEPKAGAPLEVLRKRAETVFAAAGRVERCDPARTQLENLASLLCTVARKDGSPGIGMAFLVTLKDGRSQPILALADLNKDVLDRYGQTLSELASEAREHGIPVPLKR